MYISLRKYASNWNDMTVKTLQEWEIRYPRDDYLSGAIYSRGGWSLCYLHVHVGKHQYSVHYQPLTRFLPYLWSSCKPSASSRAWHKKKWGKSHSHRQSNNRHTRWSASCRGHTLQTIAREWRWSWVGGWTSPRCTSRGWTGKGLVDWVTSSQTVYTIV